MASIPHPQDSFDFPDENQKLEFESVRSLVSLINTHMQEIIVKTEGLQGLKLKCTSKLKKQAQEFFEFSEHSVLSNLYWGMDGIEVAVLAKCVNERAKGLENSEKMLQVPASLDENGTTLGIHNSYLICSSYFYLSMVEMLRENEWQVAMHFLQAVLIDPRLVYTEFAPGICQSMFSLFKKHKVMKFDSKKFNAMSFSEIEDNVVEDAMRWMSRRYKPWLMYYQIMSTNGGDESTLADDHSQSILNGYQKSRTIKPPDSCKSELRIYHNPPDARENIKDEMEQEIVGTTIPELETHISDKSCSTETKQKSHIKCLKEILTESESQPDTPTSSLHSYRTTSLGEYMQQDYAEESMALVRTGKLNMGDRQEANQQFNSLLRSLEASSSRPKPERTLSTRQASRDQQSPDTKEILNMQCMPRSFSASFFDANISALGLRKTYRQNSNDSTDETERFHKHHHATDITLNGYQSFSRMKKTSTNRTVILDVQSHSEENSITEQNGVLEKIISKLCFTEELGNGDEDYLMEMKTIYEILNRKSGLKYSLLKDMILDQLLIAISTSKQERVVRTSVTILSAIVTVNKSAIDDIKRKGLQLYDLATALKRNVHEAVILIYLINPSPSEIKTLELLPCLVEVACASKSNNLTLTSLHLTPPAASLMIIEVLVTAFDNETNSLHLAAINSPRVLSRLLQVPRKDNLEEYISLAAILIECMRYDGKCRKYISEITPLAPFISFLWSNQKRATSIALEFFNELLQMPRSSAIAMLEQIQKQGSTNNMCTLFLLTQSSDPDYRVLAANLLLQLEVLEDTSAKSIYREEAVNVLLESLTYDEAPVMQALSAFTLSNIGGTYTWTGEPYTTAWLVKKTGLSLPQHKNVIRNYDFSDQSLQDAGIDTWSSKIAKRILHQGAPVFSALDKGLKSNLKRVSRDCLVATAWLGCELVKGPEQLRHDACEILLHTIQQYMHPGLELEERLLACLCIFNYTSGRGMKKLISLSEGVRESLRRLSSVTWMAEELLKVADYFQPNKWRISCVHSQILEVGIKSSGAVTALVYYKGQLHSGHQDGSIKVWDIKGQKATLVQDTKAHKKAVTCFALYEPGNCLLSGSADKTIKMWQMLTRILECIEEIQTKESIRSVESSGELIFAIMKNHKLKVIDASRGARDIFKSKRVKCVRVSQGRVYAGCTDSSIQELMIANNRHQVLKAASKSWMQNKPINSVTIFKDWMYSANLIVEGSKLKEWRKGMTPQVSIMPERGASIHAMEVVEDFIYLNCSTSMNCIQIWLRGTQHKVGRLSAGSKITSLLSANDMIICGTEKGEIKGWIPF